MRIKEMTMSYGRTVNLGQYNSLKVEMGMTSQLEPEDRASKVEAEMRKMLVRWVETAVDELQAEKDK